ncbi:hypothetical protein SpCBS45565_g08325 [Spizellomyces sp. 'palustris']|nr:hypothetical protein SpCBS45565_g08325 [Spizellomyces sp. 'palustris']
MPQHQQRLAPPSLLTSPPPSPSSPHSSSSSRHKQHASRQQSVALAHDITSLVLSLQGLAQRLDPYCSPVLHWVTFVLTWQNNYVSLLCGIAIVVCCLKWEYTVHLPFLLGIGGLGFAYARRLGRGVRKRFINPQPPTVPHLIHYLISVTSTLHSFVDTLDSLSSLVTFTRKSERASLGLFRAVIVSYVVWLIATAVVGVRGVSTVCGLLIIAWGSEFGQVLRETVVKSLCDVATSLGMHVEWMDEDDDEEDESETKRQRKDSVSKLAAAAAAEEAEMLRRGSDVASRHILGIRPAPPSRQKAQVTVQTAPAPGATNKKPATKAKKSTKPRSPVVPGIPTTAIPAIPITRIIPANNVTRVERPTTVITKDVVQQENSLPEEATDAPKAVETSSEPRIPSVTEAPTTSEADSGRPTSTGSSTSSESGQSGKDSRPRSGSSTDSDTHATRVRNRLAEVVARSATPNQTKRDTLGLPDSAVDLAGSQNEKGLSDAISEDTSDTITKEDHVPDESNVSVDYHPDWAFPEDETDDFRKELAGSLLRNRKPTPYHSRETSEDYFASSSKDAANSGSVTLTDSLPRRRASSLSNPTIGFLSDADRNHDTEPDSGSDTESLDSVPYLRRRRSCDSDLTIDALADFSNPRRSSYMNTPQPPSRSSSRTRAPSNASTLSSDSFSSRTRSDSSSTASGTLKRDYTVPATLLTDADYASPSVPISPTLSNHSSRSSFRGSNRKALNMILSFETYENQRWWVGVGWVPHLLPTERGAWTDHTGTKPLPKASFDLPEFRRDQLAQMNIKIGSDDSGTEFGLDLEHKRYAWDWDGPWQVDMYGSTTDEDGWEYGDNFWGGWKNRKTLKRVVRRRRWVRLARLFELGRKRSVTFGTSIIFEEPVLDIIGEEVQENAEGNVDDDEWETRSPSFDEDEEMYEDRDDALVPSDAEQERARMWHDIAGDIAGVDSTEIGDVPAKRARATSVPPPSTSTFGRHETGRIRSGSAGI